MAHLLIWRHIVSFSQLSRDRDSISNILSNDDNVISFQDMSMSYAIRQLEIQILMVMYFVQSAPVSWMRPFVCGWERNQWRNVGKCLLYLEDWLLFVDRFWIVAAHTHSKTQCWEIFWIKSSLFVTRWRLWSYTLWTWKNQIGFFQRFYVKKSTNDQSCCRIFRSNKLCLFISK